MSVAEKVVTPVPQQKMECPLCWLRRKEIQTLNYEGLGQWQCPRCGAELLAGDADTPKPAVIRERYPNGDRAPKIKKLTGAKTGRRRKKPRKALRWYERHSG